VKWGPVPIPPDAKDAAAHQAARDALLASLSALGLEDIGRSAEGRVIGLRRWDAAAGGAPLVILGGVHGDEPASVAAVVALCAALDRRPAPLPLPLLVVPAVNPDGLARGAKNSARDVDLNRNFPARNFTPAHQPGYFPGVAPLSEPETRAVAALIQAQPVRGVVAVHAPFACVNYDGPAATWAQAVAAACGWPARGDIGYPTPGSLGSWLGVDRGVPVLTLELPPGDFAAFRGPAEAALATAIDAAATLPAG
jgi:protein MpaA